MPLTFDRHSSLQENAQRIAAGHLDRAIETLEHPETLDKSVHDARKRLKRIRALLRLVRTGLGENGFSRENAAFRDAGKMLAGLRDSHVMLQTFDLVVAVAGDRLNPLEVEHIRKVLAVRYDCLKQNHLEETVAAAIGMMRKSRECIETWTIVGGFDLIEHGLVKTYGRGRRTMYAARRDPSTENLHTWRKQAEHLRFQMDMLRPLWKPVIGVYADSLHTLTDFIGDDHNLAVLEHAIDEIEPRGGESDVSVLMREMERRRKRLQRKAFRYGALVYAEKTDAFCARIGKYREISF